MGRRPVFRFLFALLAVLAVLAQPVPSPATRSGWRWAGAVYETNPAPRLTAWGDGIARWQPPDARPRILNKDRKFTAGCPDGAGGLYLLENGRLMWFDSKLLQETILETSTQFETCIAWTWRGRKGVLAPDLDLLLKFYSPGEPPADLYAIYTPSRQGGMLAADVDGDRRDDLLWGNYWLKEPDGEGHWRLFAINTFSENNDSALARLAWAGPGRLFWAASRGPARLVRHTAPEDVKQLWPAEPLPDPSPGIRALLFARGQLFAAHGRGVDRYEPDGKGFVKRVAAEDETAVYLYETGGAVWALFDSGPREIYRFK